MFRLAAVLACAALGACATKPIEAGDFLTHGRFPANDCAAPRAAPGDFPPPALRPEVIRCQQEARERAFAECRAEALREGDGARRGYYGPRTGALTQAFEGVFAERRTLAACMDAKGFVYAPPR